jgi:hypothetical protein
MMTDATNQTVDRITDDRIREIERIIGHPIPAPYSSTLMEDCRMSRPEFAAELIRAAKQKRCAA